MQDDIDGLKSGEIDKKAKCIKVQGVVQKALARYQGYIDQRDNL